MSAPGFVWWCELLRGAVWYGSCVVVIGGPPLPNHALTYILHPLLHHPTLLQLIVHTLGGEVREATGGGEYGRMPMTTVRDSTLFSTETADSQLVWMSHGDEAVRLPDGFSVVARSEQGAIVAVEHPGRKIFGLQYHPEVVHRWVGRCTDPCLSSAPRCSSAPLRRPQPGEPCSSRR